MEREWNIWPPMRVGELQPPTSVTLSSPTEINEVTIARTKGGKSRIISGDLSLTTGQLFLLELTTNQGMTLPVAAKRLNITQRTAENQLVYLRRSNRPFNKIQLALKCDRLGLFAPEFLDAIKHLYIHSKGPTRGPKIKL